MKTHRLRAAARLLAIFTFTGAVPFLFGQADSERTMSFDFEPYRVELVELDGRAIRELPVRRSARGRYEVSLAFPRFGLRTLRFEPARPV